MAFTQVTITQDFDLADGEEPLGTVTFTPAVPMVNDGVAIPAAPVVARLSSTGMISIALAATTDPGTTSVGAASATYRVDELINGVARTYEVSIPHDLGSLLPLYGLDTGEFRGYGLTPYGTGPYGQ